MISAFVFLKIDSLFSRIFFLSSRSRSLSNMSSGLPLQQMILSSKPSSRTTTEKVFLSAWKLLILREKKSSLPASRSLILRPTSFLERESIWEATWIPMPLTILRRTSQAQTRLLASNLISSQSMLLRMAWWHMLKALMSSIDSSSSFFMFTLNFSLLIRRGSSCIRYLDELLGCRAPLKSRLLVSCLQSSSRKQVSNSLLLGRKAFSAGVWIALVLLQMLMKNLLLRLFLPFLARSPFSLAPPEEPFLRLPRMKDSAFSSRKSQREEEVMISSAIIFPELRTPLQAMTAKSMEPRLMMLEKFMISASMLFLKLKQSRRSPLPKQMKCGRMTEKMRKWQREVSRVERRSWARETRAQGSPRRTLIARQTTNMRSRQFQKNLWLRLRSPTCRMILQFIPACRTRAQIQQVLMIDSLEMKFSKVMREVLGSFTSFKYPRKSSMSALGSSYFIFPVRYSFLYLSQFRFIALREVTCVRLQAFFRSTVTRPVMVRASTYTTASLSSMCWVSRTRTSAGAFSPFSRQRISPSLMSPHCSPDSSSPSLQTFESLQRNLLWLTFSSARLRIMSKQTSLTMISSRIMANSETYIQRGYAWLRGTMATMTMVMMRERGQGFSSLKSSRRTTLSDKQLLVDISLSESPKREVALPLVSQRVLQSDDSSRFLDLPTVDSASIRYLKNYIQGYCLALQSHPNHPTLQIRTIQQITLLNNTALYQPTTLTQPI